MASSRPQERRGNSRRERSTDAPQRPLGYKQKPTPADLVRMQRELQSQIDSEMNLTGEHGAQGRTYNNDQ